ncbi:MAG: ComEA family DNA-binding protein [Defluviitaleaceae bacterium]|nr:ComEA family DNA-binding protein [Defluviitaleaceae bacterium]
MEYIRRYWHIMVGVACVTVLGGVYFFGSSAGPAVHTAERTVIAEAGAADNVAAAGLAETVLADIVVHIAGAVNQPGVYTMPAGSRVNDVLAIAGGATAEADLARINLAAFLEDAQQIIIPIIREDGDDFFEPEQAMADTGISGGLVNINTASEAQLTALPGIGPVLAGNIIAYREAHGAFTSVEDLTNVPRIGSGILGNIRDLVTVN